MAYCPGPTFLLSLLVQFLYTAGLLYFLIRYLRNDGINPTTRLHAPEYRNLHIPYRIAEVSASLFRRTRNGTNCL
jgi:hypothetical protein